jgi:hypothetical protein
MNPLGLSGDFIGGRLKMKRKRIVGVVLALAVVFSCFTVPAFAQENLREEPLTLERRASGRFSITVKAGDVRKADTSFPLEKGDTVRIKASYAPADATVNFGLTGPDNQFYYIPVSTGAIDETIEVNQHEYYTLTIENTSDSDVTVNGYVNY